MRHSKCTLRYSEINPHILLHINILLVAPHGNESLPKDVRKIRFSMHTSDSKLDFRTFRTNGSERAIQPILYFHIAFYTTHSLFSLCLLHFPKSLENAFQKSSETVDFLNAFQNNIFVKMFFCNFFLKIIFTKS